tara:strand:- start:12879 stop:13751 length:873 start_codon:yes stop_codon:yes gene_type:complete
MSNQINKAFESSFSDNFLHLASQKTSKLGGAVRMEQINDAKQFFFDRMDTVSMVQSVSRHEDTPLTEVPFSRRRVTFNTYRAVDLIDNPDRVKMAKDPTSPTMKQLMAAMNRQKDDVIISAALGSAYSVNSADSASAVSLPAAQKIANGSADLTLAKLLEAKKKLLSNDVDPAEEPMYVVVGPDQLEALLSVTTNTSVDFNSVRALMNAELDTWCGFKFIISTRLAKVGNIRSCFAWAKSGLGLAMNGTPNIRISERSDKNYSTQVFVECSLGATRIEDEKVVQIDCDES